VQRITRSATPPGSIVLTTTPVLLPPMMPNPRPVPSLTRVITSTCVQSVFNCQHTDIKRCRKLSASDIPTDENWRRPVLVFSRPVSHSISYRWDSRSFSDDNLSKSCGWIPIQVDWIQVYWIAIFGTQRQT